MGKNLFLLVLCLAILGVAGWYQHQHAKAATLPAKTAATTAKKGAPASLPPGAGQSKDAAALQQRAAARAPIEAALQSMKVSSILLGDPAIVIINKKEYSVGDSLPLPGGKALPVTAIQEDGISLAANGETFHLAAPAAPDLEASRKLR